jgi:SAM-dependent methyltransferase
VADTIQDICRRLAAGSQGRTEADVQSDVRKFLLDAPLDLDGGDLTEVLLEAQAGGGRRIDVEAGNAAIEVKKTLTSGKIFSDARQQLAGYVETRTDELGQRYVGILTDGKRWLLHQLLLNGELVEVDRFDLTGGDDAPALAAWLEAVLVTAVQVTPTPKEVTRVLGAESPGCALELAGLHDLYLACRDDPEVQLKRELWSRLLTAALGTNFHDSDELFVEHTYLVLTAELIAHSVAGIPIALPGSDIRALLEGQQFEDAGLHGVVEADFFDWPALHQDGELVVRAIAKRLNRFNWVLVEHDILKALYESVIDADTRHKLGEYYTPDWLAEKMVRDHVTDPLNERVLDPSCGSGTFVFWAVRAALAAADAAGMSNKAALAHVVQRVAGVDLHPVAVTLARVTYLLAIGRDRLADRGELTIPIYLGDTVRWEQDTSLLQQSGITVHTSDGMELFAQELHFPEGILTDPGRFDRLVAALADKAADPARDPVTPARRKDGAPSSKSAKVADISGLLKSHQVPAQDRAAVELVFEKLCRLHDAGRDHVWGYYIRNLARPLSFSRAGAQADVLVGNPPWLAYRHMPELIQGRYERLAKPRGLWLGGKNATHQDLSDLFVARAVEQYLRPDGRFAFVMPYAVLSRRQYAGFRSGNFASQGAGVNGVAFGRAEDYVAIKPTLFPVPSCVVTGKRSATPTALRSATTSWTGKVRNHHIRWDEAAQTLTSSIAEVPRATDTGGVSPYRQSFSQGATFTPRVLAAIQCEAAGPLGLVAGTTKVRSARSNLEKKPWRELPDQTGVVENQFIHTMLTGAGIVGYKVRSPELTVVPRIGDSLVEGSDTVLEGFPGMAAWWRGAERLWDRHKAAKSTMSLLGRLNFQRGLQTQLPPASLRVVYTTSGQYLAACIVDDDKALVDSGLYWAPVDTLEEARYLCAVLNSDALLALVRPLQARGEHNPRHFHLIPFNLPIPAYDETNPTHEELVVLAGKAQALVNGLVFDPARRFELARRQVRESLVASGLSAEIDNTVAAVLELPPSATSGADVLDQSPL